MKTAEKALVKRSYLSNQQWHQLRQENSIIRMQSRF